MEQSFCLFVLFVNLSAVQFLKHIPQIGAPQWGKNMS